jgi:hypothetical protein
MFDQYYAKQQRGQGDFPVYIGSARQRGHGLGNIIGSLLRRILPILKSFAPHVLRSGANIVDDVKSGKTWKEAVFKRVPETVRAFTQGQTGDGARRRRKISRKRKRTTKRKSTKKRKRDIFS